MATFSSIGCRITLRGRGQLLEIRLETKAGDRSPGFGIDSLLTSPEWTTIWCDAWRGEEFLTNSISGYMRQFLRRLLRNGRITPLSFTNSGFFSTGSAIHWHHPLGQVCDRGITENIRIGLLWFANKGGLDSYDIRAGSENSVYVSSGSENPYRFSIS
jgi:hypothetical protein